MESVQTTDVLIGRVLERLESQDRSSAKFELDIKQSLTEIKEQTTKTNGRVTAVEKQNTTWASQIALIKYALGSMGVIIAVLGFFFGSSLQHVPFLDTELKNIHQDIDNLKQSVPVPQPTSTPKKNGH